MKKAMIFVALAMVVIGSCAAQSANDAQRIVGTWVSVDGQTTVVFNANGTGTLAGNNFSYGISAGGRIYVSISGLGAFNDEGATLFMSPDGKRIVISGNIFLKK